MRQHIANVCLGSMVVMFFNAVVFDETFDATKAISTVIIFTVIYATLNGIDLLITEIRFRRNKAKQAKVDRLRRSVRRAEDLLNGGGEVND
ncbi:hypothetical protein LAU42_08985 [Macrococcus armenti]|uniref:hypothetical protein n=1 Tax=Macrococcus armenti TaxID=2875764 RepID=UPI001CCD3E4F|nr:hypothetical protein [Macrococcus armenti]UBH21901.1 hypothetical protein LAU42_08985 [Macrococcus armenti]